MSPGGKKKLTKRGYDSRPASADVGPVKKGETSEPPSSVWKGKEGGRGRKGFLAFETSREKIKRRVLYAAPLASAVGRGRGQRRFP